MLNALQNIKLNYVLSLYIYYYFIYLYIDLVTQALSGNSMGLLAVYIEIFPVSLFKLF